MSLTSHGVDRKLYIDPDGCIGMPSASIQVELHRGHALHHARRALESMLRDEVGLDPRTIGGPWAAATSSFVAFASGAIIPLLPFLLLSGMAAFVGSVALSLGALFLLGLGVSCLTKRPPIRCGLRHLALGGVAALVTYVIDQAIGTAL